MFSLFKSKSRVQRLVRNQVARTTPEHTPYTGPIYNKHGREIGS